MESCIDQASKNSVFNISHNAIPCCIVFNHSHLVCGMSLSSLVPLVLEAHSAHTEASFFLYNQYCPFITQYKVQHRSSMICLSCDCAIHCQCLHCKPTCVFQENPYVMLRHNHQELDGNDRYEGFCVDMLKELADILKFKYRIRLVGDGLYGVPGANGTWTGMVGELISRVCVNMYSAHAETVV